VVKKAAILTGAVAGLLALAPVANADSGDNDGVNVLNDNNVSVLPIQACDTNVLGKLVNQSSPSKMQCVNAPVTDHPKVAVDH